MGSDQSDQLHNERALEALEEALVSFEEAIKIKPDYAEAWYGKGVTLAELNRLEEALVCFEEAIRIKPDYAKAWNSRAVALRRLKGSNQRPEGTYQSSTVPAMVSTEDTKRTASKGYLNKLQNLEKPGGSDNQHGLEKGPDFQAMDRWESNPFNLLAYGESLVVDGSNLIRQRCQPHTGKPCNNPARLWILHQLLRDKEEWERVRKPGAKCLVVTDASLRHHVENQAVLDELSNGLAIIQMPPGHASDSLILKEADETNAVVLSNDAKMKEAYASQYPWLRYTQRFMNYVIVSEKKVEYVRKIQLGADSRHKRQERPQASELRILHKQSQSRPQSSGWLHWLRSKATAQTPHSPTDAKWATPEARTVLCTNCGAPIDLSNPRVRFCYRCRTQIIRA